MIKIGLTTFKEHGSLLNKDELTLSEYASFYPIIELNTSFYGIPRTSTSEKWVNETQDGFQFIVKAYKGMTKHADWQEAYESEKEMYRIFSSFLAPLRDNQRLGAILFQFPSYFNCTRENVQYLRKIRAFLPHDMIAIELRNDSWYKEDFREDLFHFMREMAFSLVIVDQPQVPIHSVPFVPVITNESFVYLRLHGRNKGNWRDKSGDWRRKRNLYCYSETELTEFATILNDFPVKDPVIIFNNNSDGDAAPNSQTLKQLLGIDYTGLNPNQLTLF